MKIIKSLQKKALQLKLLKKIEKNQQILQLAQISCLIKYKVFQDNLKTKKFLYYGEQWPFVKQFLTKVNVGPFNVQKYFPGDHFAALHSERTGLSTLHLEFLPL